MWQNKPDNSFLIPDDKGQILEIHIAIYILVPIFITEIHISQISQNLNTKSVVLWVKLHCLLSLVKFKTSSTIRKC